MSAAKFKVKWKEVLLTYACSCANDPIETDRRRRDRQSDKALHADEKTPTGRRDRQSDVAPHADEKTPTGSGIASRHPASVADASLGHPRKPAGGSTGRASRLAARASPHHRSERAALFADRRVTAGSPEDDWKALLLLVPMRLGSDILNDLYEPCIKRILAHDSCIGIMGGRPKHSLFFVGWQGVSDVSPLYQVKYAPIFQHVENNDEM
ncbi:PREDICTED: probable cysteine protease ATG4 [Priapulus caudatus]|uniref:Cysteine protease n=1 Tax=Priapulus caudatus TaxID=37621 RepID=A0ABM1DSM2_PRICU|nr:PREDICTED: probable cysteine protease ATG4 [Priapulus caudatus]